MFYIQVFIYATFEIIHVLKERRSKYKQAYALILAVHMNGLN